MTYIGHGSIELWSSGSFTGTAASHMTNGAKQPVVAALTYLNGYFHDLYQLSIAEWMLTNPNGGAAAVWASSSLTEPGGQIAMARELFRQMFSGATLGEASIRAKSATTDHDVRRSWILFGDPTMN